MTDKYALVALTKNIKAIDMLFTYLISEEHLDVVEKGMKVLVPFGRGNKLVEGFIVDFTDQCTFDQVKTVKEVLVDDIRLSNKQLELCLWMQKRFLCTMAEAIQSVTPTGTTIKRKIVENADGSKSEKLVTEVKSTYVNILALADDVDGDELLKSIPESHRIKRKIISTIMENGVAEDKVLKKEFNATKATLDKMISDGVLVATPSETFSEPLFFDDGIAYELNPLNHEQSRVTDRVSAALDDEKMQTFLLHGVTGSGKTEVYLHLVDQVIKSGKQAVVLVPEISLTPQIVNRFRKIFNEEVAVFHSKLSRKERFDQWKLVRQGEKRIIIGARSAILAPCDNIGIIILDEEHDGSYKSESNPKFNTRDIARYLATRDQAVVLLGSATPSLNALDHVNKGDYELLELASRFNDQRMPSIDVVDMREELASGNRSIFSEHLQEKIREKLSKGEQIILFLNRKGHSTFVSCRECGYALKCPHCDISLTYHKFNNTASCSLCGHSVTVTSTCPSCESSYYKFMGTGTEKVHEMTEALFPEAKVCRLDSMTTSRKGSLEKIIGDFQNGVYNIMIGTQMVTKGLDFKNVTLVGILSADVILNIPDFTASEKAYQLITQVAGRAGRGEKPGEVVLQTYDPENYVIQCAVEDDYYGFASFEMALRSDYAYPPYKHIVNIVLSGEDENRVKKSADAIYGGIKTVIVKNKLNIGELFGPNPSIYSKIKGKHRWQIMIKYDKENFNLVRRLIKHVCIDSYSKLVDESVHLSIDIDAIKLL